MTITVDAIYENGTLKLERPLPLKEHEKVRVTVQQGLSLAEQTAGMIGWSGDVETFERILAEGEEPEELEAESIVRRSYGLLGWTGEAETVRRVALDSEFDPQESA